MNESAGLKLATSLCLRPLKIDATDPFEWSLLAMFKRGSVRAREKGQLELGEVLKEIHWVTSKY